MRMILTAVFILFFAGSAFAGEPAAQDTDASPPAATDQEAKPPLADLRDLQIQSTDETKSTEDKPPADADPDACAARDVAPTMTLPATEKYREISFCKKAYNKLSDACDANQPCGRCEKALKEYFNSCGYVKQTGPEDKMTPSAAPTPGREAPIRDIPYNGGGGH